MHCLSLLWLRLCCPCAALALVLSLKIAVVPENIFSAMYNDRLVAKGTVLEVLVVFCQVSPATVNVMSWDICS